MTRSVLRSFAIMAAALVAVTACGGGGGAGSPAATTAPGAASTAVTAVQPNKPVEFVISTAPGGGSDIYARRMQAIIDKAKLSSQPVNPVNKEGGSGAVAFQYVFEKRGDMHAIMITLNSFWTTTITQKGLPFKVEDFTPIANLANDPFFLWVNVDSPWKTAADFIKAAQEKELTASGTGSKQEDEVLFRRIQEVAKTKTFKYVPQTGGGAVATALAGHQGGVEVTVNNPSEGLGLSQGAGAKLRPICTFQATSPKEGPFKDLATCKSQGLPIDDYYVVRSIMAAPGLSAGQQKYWIDVFKGVYDSQDWKDFAAQNALELNFVAGDDFKKLVTDFTKLHTDIAQKNGWLQ